MLETVFLYRNSLYIKLYIKFKCVFLNMAIYKWHSIATIKVKTFNCSYHHAWCTGKIQAYNQKGKLTLNSYIPGHMSDKNN